MADAPKSFKVEALKAHTYNGGSYNVGDTYDFTPSDNPSGPSVEAQLESLANTGFAVRVDRKEVAQAAAREAEKAAKARAAGKTAIAPMTTDAVGVTPKPARSVAKAPKAPRVAKSVRAKK